MAVVRWDPTRDMEGFQSDMNRLFDGFFRSGNRAANGASWTPAMDLAEEGQDLVIKVDLPGMTDEDVEVEINDRLLTVSGERKAEHEDEGSNYYRVERSFGQFYRTFTLPDGVDTDSVRASFDRGVLELRIPKPVEKQPKRVQIDSGSEVSSDAPVIENSG